MPEFLVVTLQFALSKKCKLIKLSIRQVAIWILLSSLLGHFQGFLSILVVPPGGIQRQNWACFILITLLMTFTVLKRVLIIYIDGLVLSNLLLIRQTTFDRNRIITTDLPKCWCAWNRLSAIVCLSLLFGEGRFEKCLLLQLLVQLWILLFGLFISIQFEHLIAELKDLALQCSPMAGLRIRRLLPLLWWYFLNTLLAGWVVLESVLVFLFIRANTVLCNRRLTMSFCNILLNRLLCHIDLTVSSLWLFWLPTSRRFRLKPRFRALLNLSSSRRVFLLLCLRWLFLLFLSRTLLLNSLI